MIETEMDVKQQLENVDWDFSDSTSEGIHSIHPYPAKFIPEIPRTLLAILDMPVGTIVLDPFCGSGVTLVESQKAGIASVGVDLNPIACLLSKVKTQALPSEFPDIAENIVKKSASFTGKITIPEITNLDHWFKKDIQKELAILLQEINKVENEVISRALKFCLSSIIVRVSNQDSDTRYAAVEKRSKKEDVFKLFKLSADRLWKAKAQEPIRARAQVICKNSLLFGDRDLTKKLD